MLVTQSCLTLCQAPLSMGFSRQEYWSGEPFPLQGISPTQGLNPHLLQRRQILHCLSHHGISTIHNTNSLNPASHSVIWVIWAQTGTSGLCAVSPSLPPSPRSHADRW